MNKSAITDHVARENHIIDWDNAKILDKEEHKKTRWIREAIWIRSRDSTMNRDGGTYMLSHIFDPLLKNTPGGKVRTSGNTKTSGNQVSRSRSGSISATTSTQL